ncbi:MAG TPA: TolC family protein, partial [Pirellulales bacterium]|nr:TolC family protein [Pirellulales bacterium]
EYVNENIKIQQEALDIAQARFRGGLTSELDTEQAISQLAQTQALIPQYEKQLRAANDRLCLLEGIPTKDLTPDLGVKPIPPVAPDVVVGIPCDLLIRRPDVRRAEQQAASQSAQIGVAEAQLYPAISITGTVGFDAQRFTQLFKNQSLQGSIGPGFQWNVLNYGRLINNVHLNEAKFCELVNNYRNTMLKANSEAEDSIAEFLQSQIQEQDLDRSVVAADKAVKLAITQYQGGLVDFNRVALLEQDLVQQQNLLAEAEGDIDSGLVHLYRALGGGWDIHCPGEAENLAEPPVAEGAAAPNAETVPPGQSSNSSTPGFGEKPGPDMKLNAPIPNYQRTPAPSSQPPKLPGPADKMPPPPAPGARNNRPSMQSVVKRTPVNNAPLQLRRTDENGEFDWTQDDGPPPLRLSKQRAPKPSLAQTANRDDQAGANTPVIQKMAEQSESVDHPIMHAGLMEGDAGQVRLLR